mmetsp:Transcript_91847/g.263052  ORF Transcript_91847/g.263052 Transcript_91847/m.263052 type:complete len:238 (+) Transcript_91847:1251-1964(+)
MTSSASTATTTPSRNHLASPRLKMQTASPSAKCAYMSCWSQSMSSGAASEPGTVAASAPSGAGTLEAEPVLFSGAYSSVQAGKVSCPLRPRANFGRKLQHWTFGAASLSGSSGGSGTSILREVAMPASESAVLSSSSSESSGSQPLTGRISPSRLSGPTHLAEDLLSYTTFNAPADICKPPSTTVGSERTSTITPSAIQSPLPLLKTETRSPNKKSALRISESKAAGWIHFTEVLSS